jgi:two-component system sensor histidine kinase/response regulator
VASELLESVGLAVTIANNGQEAVDLAKAGNFDAILMDIQMPVLDGLAATAALRADPRFAEVPIIAMTAHAMAGDREKSLDGGMNDHVTKPIDPDALFATLAKWLRPRRGLETDAPGAACTLADQTGSAPGQPTECLPELPGVDTVLGLKRVAGNAKLYRKLLLDFQRDYAGSVEAVRLALDEGRMNDAQRLAHTLKGVAGNIGAMPLHLACVDLDAALKVEDKDKALALLVPVAAKLAEVLAGLDPLAVVAAQEAQAAAQASAGQAMDRPAVQAAARELAEMLRKSNPDAETVLERLKTGLGGTGAAEAAQIAEALDMFDFKGALAALETLATALNIAL